MLHSKRVKNVTIYLLFNTMPKKGDQSQTASYFINTDWTKEEKPHQRP